MSMALKAYNTLDAREGGLSAGSDKDDDEDSYEKNATRKGSVIVSNL